MAENSVASNSVPQPKRRLAALESTLHHTQTRASDVLERGELRLLEPEQDDPLAPNQQTLPDSPVVPLLLPHSENGDIVDKADMIVTTSDSDVRAISSMNDVDEAESLEEGELVTDGENERVVADVGLALAPDHDIRQVRHSESPEYGKPIGENEMEAIRTTIVDGKRTVSVKNDPPSTTLGQQRSELKRPYGGTDIELDENTTVPKSKRARTRRRKTSGSGVSAGSRGQKKGGLADASPQTISYLHHQEQRRSNATIGHSYDRDNSSRENRKVDEMTESAVATNSLPQLPLLVLTKIASMLRNTDDDGYRRCLLKDRLHLAAVSRQLRQAVLSSMQQMKRRHVRIDIHHNRVVVAGIRLKKPCSSYSRKDCIDALLDFVQPTSIYLVDFEQKMTRSRLLIHSLPLSVTSLEVVIELRVNRIGVDSPLDHLLKCVAGRTNLETVKLEVSCLDKAPGAYWWTVAPPALPENSPFNRLLTLGNLRALQFSFSKKRNQILAPANIADLLNRSQSKITQICCQQFHNSDTKKLFGAMNDVVRGNIVRVCCVSLTSLQAPQVIQFLGRLPHCTEIHCRYQSICALSRRKFDEFGGVLLDVCRTDDGHPGRTLDCSVGLFQPHTQKYVDEGGAKRIEYARNDTVVRLSIGSAWVLRQKHCSFLMQP